MNIIPNIGSSEVVVIGGMIMPKSNLICLVAYMASGSKNATFRKTNGTAGYTPSGTKKFVTRAIEVNAAITAAAGGVDVMLSQGDTDLGMNSASAVSNPVYFGGHNSSYIFNAAEYGAAKKFERAIPNFEVANGKYLCVSGTTAMGDKQIHVYGYEE